MGNGISAKYNASTLLGMICTTEHDDNYYVKLQKVTKCLFIIVIYNQQPFRLYGTSALRTGIQILDTGEKPKLIT